MAEDMDSEDRPQEQQQKSANLARIRDNQRRSRARRKEYLNELESKFRQCEQVGVQASAEIQAAARRVVDENRRLRLLLKQHGYSDAEIDGQVPSLPSDAQLSGAANSLEDMISARRPCRAGSECKSTTTGSDAQSQRCGGNFASSAASSSTTTPGRSTSIAASTPDAGAMHTQLRPPLSHSSSTSSGTRIAPAPPSARADHAVIGLPHNQPPAPVSHAWSYDMSYDNAPYWSGHEPLAAGEYSASTAAAAPVSCGSSSCYVAAGAIRSIQPDIGYELEEELGCANGKDCTVANAEIFRIMERYQDH